MKGVDYNLDTNANIENLFNEVCIELVKSDKTLLSKAKEICKQHINTMYQHTVETDVERSFLDIQSPTWFEMKRDFDSVIKY